MEMTQPEASAKAVQRMEYLSKLVPQARLQLPPPTLGTPSAATVVLFIADSKPDPTLLLVWDDLKLSVPPSHQYTRIVLSEDKLDAMVEDVPFLDSAADVPFAQRCVAMFLARCGKCAEGFFYGGGSFLGRDGCFIAASRYEAVECPTLNPRLPDSFKEGAHIQVKGFPNEYVICRILIAAHPGQVRFYAVIGDERALDISSTLIPRYAIVPLVVDQREANIQLVQPLSSCPGSALDRFLFGLGEYMQDVCVGTARKGERNIRGVGIALPAGKLASSYNMRERQERQSEESSFKKSAPTGLEDIVMPSQFPFDLKNCGVTKFKDGLRKELPPPSIRKSSHTTMRALGCFLQGPRARKADCRTAEVQEPQDTV